MMDELIRWPKTLPSHVVASTRDEMLTWMIEIWMEIYLASDSDCNTVTLQPLGKNYKEWQIMLG